MSVAFGTCADTQRASRSHSVGEGRTNSGGDHSGGTTMTFGVAAG